MRLFYLSFLFLMALSASAGATENQLLRNIAKACPSHWEKEPCLKAVSEASVVMAATYIEALQVGGYKAQGEIIKEHCAAGTAGMQGGIPAYALKSAWTECVNKIFDVSEQTGIKPEPTLYELVVTPVMCLEGRPECKTIENNLRKIP